MQLLNWLSTEPLGQTGVQLAELTLALVLSSLIGLEREFRLKSAGLRTHTLVGVAAALLMLVSKFGFTDVLSPDRIVLDPSRVAAQIVTGIGFIGGGLIFVQRDVVRGLTTAATIWLTAAVGMACGGGLPILAVFVTGAHFLVMVGYRQIERRVLSSEAHLRVRYRAGRGAVREIMKVCTGRAFSIHEVSESPDGTAGEAQREMQLRLHGRGDLDSLVVAIADLQDVLAVQTDPSHAKP